MFGLFWKPSLAMAGVGATALQIHAQAGVDPGFSERGSEYRGGLRSRGSGGHSPPEAIGCFNNITPKSCLMEDLEYI